MKMEDMIKIVLKSLSFIVISAMIYESEAILSCLVQLMDNEEQIHLNFKWLTIFLAFTSYGILTEPSLEVSKIITRILISCSTIIVVSIITIVVIYGALFLSFATHNFIQIHQVIVQHFDFKWLMIFLHFMWYGIIV